MVRPPKNSMVMAFPKTIENFQWSLQTIEMCNGFLKTIELVNGLLKSFKFTMFSEKNGTFLWSQLEFSILLMLFCDKV